MDTKIQNDRRFPQQQQRRRIQTDTQRTGDPHHIVPMTSAFDYIFQFVNCYSEVGIRDIGGYIDKETLIEILKLEDKRFDAPKDGLLFWYNYNPLAYSPPNFFLSLTDDQHFDTANPPVTPDIDKTYFRPTQTHQYHGSISGGELLRYIIDTNHYSNSPCTRFGVDAVALLSTSYRENFPFAINGDDYRSPFNCGLFYKQHIGITELLGDDIRGINYYFGIITDQDIPQVCVVLIAVGANGKNIFHADALILERSWPPYGS